MENFNRFDWIGVKGYYPPSHSLFTQWNLRCKFFADYVRAIEFKNKMIKEINGDFNNTLKLKSLLSTLNIPRNENRLNVFLQKDIDIAYERLIGTKKVWDKELTFEKYITRIRELSKINY